MDKSAENLDIKPTDVIHWETMDASKNGNTVTVPLRLRTEGGFSLYEHHVKFAGPPGWELEKKETPATRSIVDPIDQVPVNVYDGGEFVLTFSSLEPLAKDKFELSITYLGCTERICLFPFTEKFELPVFQDAGLTSTPKTATTTPAPSEHPSSPVESLLGKTSERDRADLVASGQLPFMLLLLVLFLGGLATNLTPCVLPMIPITVRIISSEKNPVLGSGMYVLGIVASYTTLGLVVAFTGGMFGSFMASPILNAIFAVIFAVLALGMLGFGNLSGLQNLGLKISDVKTSRGPLSTFMIGLGAGLVAAPCTGPILGGLITFTAKSADVKQATLQFFIYSLGFALPYQFLGMASNKVSKVKVSSAVSLWVKWVFAAVMVALSFYYFRIPLYEVVKKMNGSWKVSSMIAVAAGLGIFLLSYAQPSLRHNKTFQLIPTAILGFGLFAGSQWLSGRDAITSQPITWLHSIDEGMEVARQTRKPIFVDGWAEWCEACKKMDVTTFVDPEVTSLITSGWVPVKLDFTQLDEANMALGQKYDLLGLPTVVLLPPDGDITKMTKITGQVNAAALLQHMQKFQATQNR
ncbi:MAG: cytochrome c biogenesis protein CcdA [Oligoflexales bacterium]